MRLAGDDVPGRSILRENHLVFRIFFVPQVHQFIGALADVLAVDDRAREHAREVEPVGEGGIRPVLDFEPAIQADGGSPDAEPVHFDGASGAAELDDLVADFLDS